MDTIPWVGVGKPIPIGPGATSGKTKISSSELTRANKNTEFEIFSRFIGFFTAQFALATSIRMNEGSLTKTNFNPGQLADESSSPFTAKPFDG